MKISFPRHILYLTLLSIFLLIFAIWFATQKLIPMGKEHRANRIILKKERLDLARYREYHDKTKQLYNETKSKHRHIIEAFETPFDMQRFKSEYGKYFIELSLSKLGDSNTSKWYEIYEVQTLSKIQSPVSFYDFLSAINKSAWIVGVTFPIDFTKEGELIRSSFKMQVYKKVSDENATQKRVEQAH